MAGRGRGGKTSSLTQDQLQTLGCVGKDVPQVQTAPPPTYPPLISQPVHLETTDLQKFQILWKEEFFSQMRESPYFLTPLLDTKATNAQQFSGTNITRNVVESTGTTCNANFKWKRMPKELHVLSKKRRTLVRPSKTPIKKPKVENVEDHLKKLVEKEGAEKHKEMTAKNVSDSEHEENEELPVDEEMDDENDYGNSYFDNGESYNEDDDNFDDGPVY